MSLTSSPAVPTHPSGPVVVIGATGHLGRHVVEHLVARGVAPAAIIATGRSVERLADQASRGVDVRSIDRDDADALAQVLTPGARVLLISGTEPQRVAQHARVIELAAAAEVERVVYTSGPRASTSSLDLLADHAATERLLADSTVPSVVVRNAWYVENYTDQAPVYREFGMASAAGEGTVSLALRREYAEAAVAALLDDAHLGATYELGGPAATHAEIAAAIGAALGIELAPAPVTEEQLAGILAGAGLPDPMPAWLAQVDSGIARGELLVPTDDLERLLGRAPLGLADAVAEALAQD
ncbi:NAD(P)H-binding protein [Nocardioides sp.]|uniref:NAD(P)H-binding protein n=1 Tax=Nocardioides sp. TaxID=35761 RepID=UPI0035146229